MSGPSSRDAGFGPTAFCTRPQRDHLAQHADTIVNEVNFAAFGVVPAHRYFLQTQAGALGEKEQLDIESEPLHVRRFEDWATDIEPKRFEPALRIPKRQAGRKTHE